MADDIFDKALAASKGKAGRDVFDQALAAKTPDLPDTNKQAAAAIANIIPQQEAVRSNPILAGPKGASNIGAYGNLAQTSQNLNDYMQQSGNLAGNVAGTLATGGVLPAVKGAGIATKALRLAGRSLATGAGAGAGSLAGGATPQEAAANAAGGVVAQPIAEGLSAAGGAAKAAVLKKIATYGQKPASEIAELQSLIPKEDAIQAKVIAGKQQAFKNASAAYPEIQTPVDIAPAREAAQQAQQQMVANRVPTVVGQAADLSRQPISALDLDSMDAGQLVDLINKKDAIPFKDAQKLYSALGQKIAAGKGNLPGEVYSSLKSVRDSLANQMKATADSEGKLAQYTAAQENWKGLMKDWQNVGAPLRDLTNPASAKDFALLKKLVGDNGGNATKTLEKYGVDTSDIKALQSMGKKQLLGKISDAAEISRMGPDAFQQLSAQQAKAQLMSKAKSLIKPVVGGGGVIGAYEYLTRKK